MRITRQHRREARLLWQIVTADGIPDVARIKEVVGSVQQDGGREAEAILRCFVQRLEIYIRANQVGIVSADRLSSEQQAQLSGLFRGKEATKAGIQFSVDPALIGGLRVEKGYQVTDMTIARQLAILQSQLLKN